MKHLIFTIFVVLTMVSCGKKAHEGTKTTTGEKITAEKEKVTTTVVFRELPIALDLPSLPPFKNEEEMRNWNRYSTTIISTASDKLLADFEDLGGLDPLYNNWKTVGPIHNSSYTARLVEVNFDGPRPRWFNYKLADQIMDSARYDHPLGLHDLVNLVSKYGDALPADTPIVGFGSVAAYYSYAYMNVGKKIQSPAITKRNGKWYLSDFRILYGESFTVHDSQSVTDYPYHPPLFLVDVDKNDTYRKPLQKVKIFLDVEDVRR